MTNLPLARSRTQRVLGGVCGGVAETFDLDARLTRAAAVILVLFTSAPVLVAYVVGWIVLPLRSDDDHPPVEVDWESDALTLRYPAAIAPWSVSWVRWAVGALLAFLGLVATWLGVFGISLTSGTPLQPELCFMAFPLLVSMWPVFAMLLAGGAAQRPYLVTCSHSTLRIKRPLRAAEDVDLGEVAHAHGDERGVSLELRSGDRITLPPMPDATARDLLLEQITKGSARAASWESDLRRAEDERRRLAEVAARGQREGG